MSVTEHNLCQSPECMMSFRLLANLINGTKAKKKKKIFKNFKIKLNEQSTGLEAKSNAPFMSTCQIYCLYLNAAATSTTC